MDTRLERFRGYMAQLDAAANPRYAFERKLYVAPPYRSRADELALRLKLNPTSSHLVVGGVGSGKTTQLLVAQQSISELHDTDASYIDVSMKHDLASMKEGVLVVLAGLILSAITKSVATKEVKAAAVVFRRWAHGYTEWIEAPDHDDEPDYEQEYDPEPGYYVQRKGIIAPPLPPLSESLLEKSAQLKVLRDALPTERPHIAILFDSLDRLPTVEAFRASVQNDVRALQCAGVASVIVGPSRVLYGPHRSIADLFDHWYWQATIDIRQHPMQEFLTQVLQRRADQEVLPDDACLSIVAWSGGVMRDLISIARRAGEEAYLGGGEVVRPNDVVRAADGFGRSLMLGLGPKEIQVLQTLRLQEAFVPTSDQELALVETRRVLDYGGETAPRYAVHPTLVPLLAVLS